MSAAATVREFALPDLGEGLTEAEILNWLVNVGDTVTVDQAVAEVETAKTAVEVPCPYSGRVTALHGTPGETVNVGAPFISIDTAAPEADAGPGGTGAVVPETRESAENGHGGNGAAADSSGSGAVLVGYGTSEGRRRRGRRRAFAAGGPGTKASEAPSPQAAGARRRTPVVSPLVRRIAREHGVDVAALDGSGEGGLVLRRDVQAAITSGAEAVSAARNRPGRREPTGSARAEGPAAAPPSGAERIPLRGLQRAMAEQLTRSRREIPEATVWVDADATGLLGLRSALNEAAPNRPVSVLALLAKFCLLGLGRFPALNSQVDAERSELVRFSHVNLGIAAQTARGLAVPVVHDAHTMTTRELSAGLDEVTTSARAGTLTPDQLAGGTFTVNNYGVFGVDGSAAIINHPEAAILGMGRIVKRPWVVGDELAVRPVTELTLAFDHRVCDGEEAGGFLRFVADCVERPGVLLGDL